MKSHTIGIVVCMVMFFALLGIAVAQVETLTYEQGTIIDLKESCFNNGSLCSSSANCNISIFSPRGEAIVKDFPMTQNPSRAYFNFTLNGSSTDRVGFYRYDIVCADSGLVNFGSFNLQVTAGGNDPSIPQTISYAILLLLLVGLFIFSVFGFVKCPARNHMRDDGMIDINYMKYLKFVLFFVSYLLLMSIMFAGWQMALTVSYLDILSGIFRVATFTLLGFLTPIFIISVIMAFILLITDKKTIKAITRGVPVR